MEVQPTEQNRNTVCRRETLVSGGVWSTVYELQYMIQYYPLHLRSPLAALIHTDTPPGHPLEPLTKPFSNPTRNPATAVVTVRSRYGQRMVLSVMVWSW